MHQLINFYNLQHHNHDFGFWSMELTDTATQTNELSTVAFLPWARVKIKGNYLLVV